MFSTRTTGAVTVAPRKVGVGSASTMTAKGRRSQQDLRYLRMLRRSFAGSRRWPGRGLRGRERGKATSRKKQATQQLVPLLVAGVAAADWQVAVSWCCCRARRLLSVRLPLSSLSLRDRRRAEKHRSREFACVPGRNGSLSERPPQRKPRD